MVVVKIICYAGLCFWLGYEIYQLVKAIKERKKLKAEEKKQLNENSKTEDK